jgi:hypothetical protein
MQSVGTAPMQVVWDRVAVTRMQTFTHIRLVLSIGAALAIAVAAAVVSRDSDASLRTVAAAFGGLLVISAMMSKALR